MTREELKLRLVHVELAGLSGEQALAAADPAFQGMDGFDKAIEVMEGELGFTELYPLTPIRREWALKRARRHALNILLNHHLLNINVSLSVGSFPISQITASVRDEVRKADEDFRAACAAGQVAFGPGAVGGGFSVSRVSWGTDPQGRPLH